jgi:hypothetical protein
MKIIAVVLFLIFSLAVVSNRSLSRVARAQDAKKMPDTIVLSKEAKLGGVVFNHLKHATNKWSADGTKQIACVDCHHVAQPLAEALKHPPHKTVWPPDRTTTLTAELLLKDPSIVVPRCTDCHARADGKPRLLPEVPSLTFEGAAAPTVLNNQQVFHRNCGGCHDEAVKLRPALDPWPATSKKCTNCHKRTQAAAAL